MKAREKRHVLLHPQTVAPWVAPMSAHLVSQLGTDSLGQTAISLLTSALSPSTYQSYHQKLNKFARFCAEQGKLLLECSTHDVLRYVAWLAREGRVAADSIQPYLSAINRLYQDLGLPVIASGPLVTAAVKGLQGMQQPAVPRELERAPIPAQVVYDMLVTASHILDSVVIDGLAQLRLARACLATIVAFLFFARPGANANVLDADLVVVTEPHRGIQLLPRGTKGKGRVQAHKLTPLFVPSAVFTNPAHTLPPVDLAALLVKFKQLRNSAFGGQAPVHMWSVPGEQVSVYGSTHQTTWLQTALTLTLHSPPSGHTWTGHSMRKGAASAASAVGVPHPKICYYGGWAVASNVMAKHYIDPTCPVTPAASFFFSWLAQGPPAPVAVAASGSP